MHKKNFLFLPLILFGLSLFLVPKQSLAGWAYVQTKTQNSFAGSNALAFNPNNASSNLIVATVYWTNTSSFTSISDSQGNIYVQIGTELNNNDPATGLKSRMYYAANIKSGANTVTTVVSGSPAIHLLIIQEYSGIATSSPLDVSSWNTTTTDAGHNWTSNATTTTAANDLLVGHEYGGTSAVTSGWTTRSTALDLSKDKNATTTGSYAFSGTTSYEGEYYIAWMAAFLQTNNPPSGPSSLGPTNKVNGSWSTSTQPQLSFTQSDPDTPDTVKYRIQISTSSSYASLAVDYTSALMSQTSTSFTVGQAAGGGTYTVGAASQTLPDGQYYWKVMTTDNSGATSSYTTANSGSVAFGVDNTAPSGSIPAPTFETITTSSIIINRPSTSTITESGSGLNQWQARRNSITTLSAISTSTATTSDSSLTSNTQYAYDVRFIDLLGNNSSYSSTSSKYTLTPDPTNFSATPSQTSNALSVDSFNNASSSSSGYYFSNTTNSNNSGWITTNSWTDTGLACNTSYTYTIKYRNGDSTESATSSLSQTTSACSAASVASTVNAGLPISILSPPKSILPTTYYQLPTTSQPVQTSNYAVTQPLFTRYLYPGTSHPQVKELQTLLSNYSDIYPEARITGYYGQLTKQAVQRLQIKYNITNSSDPAYGYVGPKTRYVLNLLHLINDLQKQINQIRGF